MTTSFANFIREKRVAAGLTLREFCRATGHDPSNWSKIERGIMPPPQSRKYLSEIADILKIDKESEEYKEMIDLSAISTIPEDLIELEILEQLPVFFRTIRGGSPSEKDLDVLINKIKSSWTPEK